MENFLFFSHESRVLFGFGTIKKLPNELVRLHLNRPLILCTSQQLDHALDVRQILKDAVAGIFSEATMHTPTSITTKGLEFATSTNADSVISIGGGSTIGLGKAICVRSSLYHVAIPTTYAGSEVTPILGETENGEKKTRSDPRIRPGTIIYDVNLTMSLPARFSATSGINAMAHAVESLYAKDTNPVINLLAREAIQALSSALPEIMRDPGSRNARFRALYGAWLCGICLGAVGMSLHHKLCHVLGGHLNLPHAETHAIVLPYALSYNAPKIRQAMEVLNEALPPNQDGPIGSLISLLRLLGIDYSLGDLGMKQSDIPELTRLVKSNTYWNPRTLEQDGISELLRRAWCGETPNVHP